MTDNDMVLLSIHVDVLKKDHSELVQTLISIGNEVRKQPGCISYQIQQDVEAQNHITLESEWDDNDAVKVYINSKNFSVTMGAIKTFSISPQIKIGNMMAVDHDNFMGDVS